MELSKIFTKKNIEILNLLTNRNLHLRDIAKQLNISPAKVHSTIKLFKKYNMIKEIKDKNKRIITLNKESSLLNNLQNILASEVSQKRFEPKINIFDLVNPIDFRYYGRNKKAFHNVQMYLSENAMIKYMAEVEYALTKTLAKRKICKPIIAEEIHNAIKKITAEEVYEEEDRIKHNVRALVNCIRKKVSEQAKPYVHFTTTSHDIIATADSLRFMQFANNILIPALKELEKNIITIALREKNTIQIGRTHGQHAVPITFGFSMAQYVSRIGKSIIEIRKTANNLRGKIAGAVGSYNASSLFFEDPEKFEAEVLANINLKPSPISTQIPQAEYMTEFVNAIIESFGVLANLADDMRNLQRSEISEVAERFGQKQVGSSTMPQKRNPINFENVKSLWKAYAPRMITVYMDQISEHQRDLTNSASSRYTPETLTALYVSILRLSKVMSNLTVDKQNLQKNFNQNKGLIVAEPLYILLAAYNHPDAHEIVRELTLKAQSKKQPLTKIIKNEKSLQKYLKLFNKHQLRIISNPENYTGIAAKKTQKVCDFWKKELKI